MNFKTMHLNFSLFLLALLLLYDVTNKTSFDNIQVGYFLLRLFFALIK